MRDPVAPIHPPDATEALSALAGSFRHLSDGFIAQTQRHLELARATGDEPGVVRQHIKIEVMRAAQKMFRGSYRAVAGAAAWDDTVRA